MWWPDSPRMVIASRAEVLLPSETSTRSGLGTWGDAMPASSLHALALSPGLMTEDCDASRVPPFTGAAMQRYSWTNNRQPVFWRALPGRISTGFSAQIWSTFSPHRNKPRPRKDRQFAAHAGGDFARPLGQPFPSVRAADAVPVPEGATRRRLYRAWLRVDRARRRLRPDASADRLSRRPYRRPQGAADGADARRLRAGHARPAI